MEFKGPGCELQFYPLLRRLKTQSPCALGSPLTRGNVPHSVLEEASFSYWSDSLIWSDSDVCSFPWGKYSSHLG